MQQLSIFPSSVFHATFEAHEAHAYKENGHFISSIPINVTRAVTCDQVHGSEIRSIRSYPTQKQTVLESCDGMITNLTDLTLMVKHADCLPVFVFDPKRQVIGMFHSGWKGSRDKIIVKGLGMMISEYGCDVKDILIGVGPGARQCCYYFEESWEHSQLLAKKEWELFIKRHGKRYYVDLQGFIRSCALQAGALEKNIEVSPYCTIENTRFHSWRRQKERGEKCINGVSIMTLV